MTSLNRKVQRAATAKQTKKSRAETNAVAKKKVRAARAPQENDEPLSPEAEARLSELAKQIATLHRKSTSQVFELGQCLAEAKSVQPQKRFGRWLKENSGYSVRSAWSFISVHDRLADHRERLEQHAVATTALFELAKGEPDQIEDVIKQFDEGKSLKSMEIKTLIGGKKDETEENADPRQMGGKSGLQKMAATKLKMSTAEMNRLIAAVLVGVEEAIARHESGKRIVMAALAADVEINARHASDLFKDIVAPLVPVQHMPKANLEHESIGLETGWGAVQHSLYRLGGVGSWPVRDEMEKWVIDVAHPALRFAVHGEPYVVSAKPAGVIVAEVAKADSDVTKNDHTMVEKETDVDETTPNVSDAELDATLDGLMAASKTTAEARMSR
ncbi:Protein of unknown function (DUF3102) [Hoeflea sp. IMCC20628]|uniref:DUF3102 domain-containing protein n=1 Tax=Hoeflea sp. IMCC20628 TaxID=1620421 RepID=UPI00063BD571|nr:DUF3102 domain-containing protein [Hoeflea sp. IMCC20628]AKI02692.1 Protein of unknown function (DUF3102) [Hoeflea sp. IMCC20628]